MNNQPQKKSDKTLVIVLICALGIPAVLVIGLVLVMFLIFVSTKSYINTVEKRVNEKYGEVQQIPSGEEQTEEKKEKPEYYTYAKSYIKEVSNAINAGNKIYLSEDNKMIIVPVGKDKCISAEKEPSELNYWKFAYVAVTYNSSSGYYNFYFAAVDKNNKGTYFFHNKETEDDNSYSYMSSLNYKVLKDAYSAGENKIITSEDLENDKLLKALSNKTGITDIQILSNYCN